MDKQISSYWGNVSYVGLKGPAGAVVRIESHELLIASDDPVLKGQALRLTHNDGVAKLKPFIVFERRGSEKFLRVLAIYYVPQSRELIYDVRQSIGEPEFLPVLQHYKPDYIAKDLT